MIEEMAWVLPTLVKHFFSRTWLGATDEVEEGLYRNYHDGKQVNFNLNCFHCQQTGIVLNL